MHRVSHMELSCFYDVAQIAGMSSTGTVLAAKFCSDNDSRKRLDGQGGVSKNAYELLNLRTLKFSPVNKIYRYFVWNFKRTLWNSTQNILPIHSKTWFLYNIEILRALMLKNSYVFLKRPQITLTSITEEISPDLAVMAGLHPSDGKVPREML